MNYKNKRILFMGDSITALNTSERGWVKYFNEVMEPSFFMNVAVPGACLANRAPVVFDGNPLFLGDKTDYNQNVVLNQVEKISRAKDQNNEHYIYNPDFESFDLIIISAGSNDGFDGDKCNIDLIDKQFISDGKVVESEKLDCATFSGAMRCIYEKLKALYPNAKIYFCSPIQAVETTRTYASIIHKRNVISAICDRISDVNFIDTFNCGICSIYEKAADNGRDLIDGLHPNISGAKKIAEYNARAIKQSLL